MYVILYWCVCYLDLKQKKYGFDLKGGTKHSMGICCFHAPLHLYEQGGVICHEQETGGC